MKIIAISLLILFFVACGGTEDIPEHKSSKKNNNATKSNSDKNIKFLKVDLSPKGKLAVGQKVTINCTSVIDSIHIDSVLIKYKQKQLACLKAPHLNFEWLPADSIVGKKVLFFEAYAAGLKAFHSASYTFLSNIEPENLTYKVKKIYKHDKHAYTQGLIFYDGFIYESTGVKGESSLRKVKFETGEVLQSYTIPHDIFGEGITIYKDKIIMLTYKAGIGYVYNRETFQLLTQFNYPTQGWGITTIDDQLVMSDGTFTLYFLDPNSYLEVSTIEVFDNNGPVDSINEMELINGVLFANVYMRDKIVKIDYKTGRILAYIHLDNILPEEDKFPGIDVLNGICYDKENDRIFVTGKRWPKLFEVEFVK